MGLGKFLKKASGIGTAKKLLKADPITSKVIKKDPIARKSLSMDPIGRKVLGGRKNQGVRVGEPNPSGSPGQIGYERGTPLKRPVNRMNKLAGLKGKRSLDY